MSSERFYSDLPVYKMSLSEILAAPSYFADIPKAWHVIITDIKNSTIAFESGRHEEINLIATGSIIAVLNLAQTAGIQIPFFFGGDGAAMIVPEKLHKPSLEALRVHKRNTLNNEGLDLRVGSVPVSELIDLHHTLTLSRLLVSDLYSIPILIGDGLTAAELIIKGEQHNTIINPSQEHVDLTGMECRWDRIKPASNQHEVLCLLATASETEQQALLFKKVFDEIDRIYGPYEKRNPVSPPQLRLDASFSKIARETRIKKGGDDLFETAKNWLITKYGKWFYMNQKAGLLYKQQLVKLTDTLVIDGKINTVIAGTKDQRIELEAALNKLEQDGHITYGIFISRESVMSCYVQDYKSKHIHFVDGSDGGYTMAAKMLKKKLKAQSNP